MSEGSNDRENDSENLKSWMMNNGQTLKDKTYEILNNESVETLGDLKQFTVDEFDNMCNEKKIVWGDRTKLKRILEEFSNKDKYVDPEEKAAIDTITNEMNKLKNILNNLSMTQTQIKQKNDKLIKDINDTFDKLRLELKNRETELLSELQQNMETKSKIINDHLNMINNNLLNYGEHKQKCQKMLKQMIELNEIDARKLQFVKIKDDIVANNAKIINTINNNKVNANIDVIIDKQGIIQYVKQIGVVQNCVVPQLMDLQHDGIGNVIIVWTLKHKQDQQNHIDKKLMVEWTDIESKTDDDDNKLDHDGNDNDGYNFDKEWKYKKEFVIGKINKSKINIKLTNKTATYLFRIKYFNGKSWSINSNIKSLTIYDDEWDKNNTGSQFTINGKTITKSGVGQQSAFLSNVVSQGTHIWRFKAGHLTDGNWNPLGIWKTNSGKPIIDKTWTNKANNGYAYRISANSKVNPANKYSAGSKYGVRCKSGDEIEMILNFDTLSLSYKVNNVDYGKAFDIEKTTYRVAFNCYYDKNSLTLLSYGRQ